MRRVPLALLTVGLAAAAGFSGPTDDADFDPQFANIVAACTPGATPQVQPQRVTMTRQDNVIWRVTSGQAASWTISPKNPSDWLFAQASFTGTPENPATTPQPRAEALANHPYAYNVSITCADGSVQVIDPDIVIGGAE